ncbi:DNA-binding GntR family transcriptional regulator [Brevibacterium sanguinis]|uniref:DNA-binding GntR family transcriptional regulator n=3 Tax=Brevibacteriaceae TaxID=85019 RepID=A0A366IDZ1_9MICO|nr:DNA-binding GntR family transcriptional regulator [Brevibacterium sanguinis]RBP69330.1 DNA-binding GntR family transcriptional regulator [Brevibacterium celere]
MRRQAVARVTESSIAEVSAELGVSPSSLRRWVARADLDDRPRSGRPPIQSTANQVVEALVATAGARISGRDYSTRALAEATGLSQSIVSRAMRDMTVPLAELTGARRGHGRRTGEITVVAGGFPFIVFGFRGPGEATDRGGGAENRDRGSESADETVPASDDAASVGGGSIGADGDDAVRMGDDGAAGDGAPEVPARRVQRRIAGIVAALRSAGVQHWVKRFDSEHRQTDPGAMSALLLRPAGPAEVRERFVVFDPLGETADLSIRADAEIHREFGEFLDALKRALAHCNDIPGSLLDLVAARVRHGFEGVMWQASAQRRSHESSISSDSMDISSWLPKTTRSITEHLAIALREEIIDSGYQPGDRINPRLLSRRMEVPRSSVDAALRRMVDDELLDGSRGGARIPLITTVDVLDLYAARVAVGEVLLRALAMRPKRYFVPVQLALRQVEASAATKSGIDVENADLHFQQELARASGLRQSARAFESLTLRLRLFISVLQLDYSPAGERILVDDRAIFSALVSGDAESAIDTWRGKVDNAVRHMAGLLSRRRFDQDLWAQLTRRFDSGRAGRPRG